MRARHLATLALLAGLVTAACQEDLSAPSSCPGLCPGQQAPVQEIVLLPSDSGDLTYPAEQGEGYVSPAESPSLRISDVPDLAASPIGSRDLAVARLRPRGDSVLVGDTLRPVASFDSVRVSFVLQARDTSSRNLRVLLYRLPTPAAVDTTVTYAELAGAVQPSNLVDSLPIADSVTSGVIGTTLRGADLARLGVSTGADTLALVLAAHADGPTALRVAAQAEVSGGVSTDPVLAVWFTTVRVADSTVTTTIETGTVFDTYASESPAPAVDPATLVVGGAPAKRSLVRFTLPPVIRDSARVVRATLELVPVSPISGVFGDPGTIQVRTPAVDLGPKSPLVTTSVLPASFRTVDPGASAAVSIEVTRLLRFWVGDSTRPTVAVLSVVPEGASFTRGIFHSSRASDPALRPRLRIDYVLPFDFEAP